MLEVGAGSGLNFAYYGPDAEVVAVEPAEGMRRRAATRLAESRARVELVEGRAKSLLFDDASFDAVVSTFVLCSVGDLDGALDEMRRVLKPDGALHLVEHCLDPDPRVAKWQRRIQPAWGWAMAGCQLTRDLPRALEARGFDASGLEALELPLPRIVQHSVRGRARKLRS